MKPFLKKALGMNGILLSQKFCKFSAFSLEFQTFFSITRTIFSHSRSEQFGNKIPCLYIHTYWRVTYLPGSLQIFFFVLVDEVTKIPNSYIIVYLLSYISNFCQPCKMQNREHGNENHTTYFWYFGTNLPN